MQVEIVKWGNSSAVRLPAAAMKDLHIALGDRLELETVEGNIALKPSPKAYCL
jgi:antitoxin component of MazEF toxin-antitoxin module